MPAWYRVYSSFSAAWHGFVRIRYYGFMANRDRSLHLECCRAAINGQIRLNQQDEEEEERHIAWAGICAMLLLWCKTMQAYRGNTETSVSETRDCCIKATSNPKAARKMRIIESSPGYCCAQFRLFCEPIGRISSKNRHLLSFRMTKTFPCRVFSTILSWCWNERR